jgi:dienelactone hydrolase
MSQRALLPLALAFGLAGGSIAPSLIGAADFPTRRQLADLFTARRIDQVALSPDGRRVAYAVNEGLLVHVVLLDLEEPAAKRMFVPGAAPNSPAEKVKNVAAREISYLKWVDATQLVYAVVFASQEEGRSEEIRTVDVNGAQDRALLGRDKSTFVFFPTPPVRPRVRSNPGAEESEEGAATTEQPLGLEDLPPPQEISRQLRVLGLVVDPSPGLLVEAGGRGPVPTDIFHVPFRDGQVTTVKTPKTAGRLLLDWKLQPRILETPPEIEGDESFPASAQTQVFQARLPGITSGWRDLDRIVGEKGSLQFRHYEPEFFKARSFPLTFGHDPDILYFASNIARDTFGLYALDLRTLQRTDFKMESTHADLAHPAATFSPGPLVFDRAHQLVGVRWTESHGTTRWLDPKLAAIQEAIEREFTSRFVEIIEWNEERTRALAHVTGSGAPGRYIVFQSGDPARFIEVLRRAPAVTAESLHRSVDFAFETPENVRLTGTLVIPRRPRVTPPALVLMCRDIPNASQAGAFEREMQALASFGFMVAQVNHRGTSGFGARHRDAALEGLDRVPLEDLRATLTWLGKRHPFDPRRVALFGQGFGGYLALRGLQLHPDVFRCAVAINAPTDPLDWRRAAGDSMATPRFMQIERDAFFAARPDRELAALSLFRHPTWPRKPMLLVVDPSRPGTPASSLSAGLKRHKVTADVFTLPAPWGYGHPDTAARAFTRMGEFLNEHMYAFGVNIGELQEVK